MHLVLGPLVDFSTSLNFMLESVDSSVLIHTSNLRFHLRMLDYYPSCISATIKALNIFMLQNFYHGSIRSTCDYHVYFHLPGVHLLHLSSLASKTLTVVTAALGKTTWNILVVCGILYPSNRPDCTTWPLQSRTKWRTFNGIIFADSSHHDPVNVNIRRFRKSMRGTLSNPFCATASSPSQINFSLIVTFLGKAAHSQKSPSYSKTMSPQKER